MRLPSFPTSAPVGRRSTPADGLARRLRDHARVVATVASVATVVLAATAAHAVPAPAGTTLDNAATTAFVDSATSLHGNATSNVVHAVVAQNESLQLTPAVATVRVAAGRFAVATRVVADGNVATPFFATLASVAGGAFVPQGAQVVVDLNGNGIADPGEPVVSATTPLTLAPGASVALLIVGTVPGGAAPASSAALTLTITSQDQSVVRTATATLTTAAAAQVAVTAVATPTAPVQGAQLAFALEARTSDTPVSGSVVTVDGTSATLVLLRAPLPANTTLVDAAGAAGATVLYHHRNDPPNQYFTSSGPLNNVDGVAFAATSVAAGQSLSGRVVVGIANNASGTLASTALLTFSDQGVDRSVPATPVQLALPALRSSLTIYGTTAFIRPIKSFTAGSQLFLQLDAASCNVDPDVAETRQVLLKTVLAGDSEIVNVVETGPNTGIFRSVLPVVTSAEKLGVSNYQDGLLTVRKDDTVSASPVGCGADALIASTLVDPAGVVFDSRSNAPVNGAIVTLIDVTGAGNGGKPGQPAVVYAFDGVNVAPAALTTTVDGAFVFPLVNPSTYRLVVVPPAGYTGPSKVAPAQLPAGHNIDPAGSYGNTFVVANDVVFLDYPADAAPITGLFVEKTASKSVADIGDYVDYSVTIRNTSAVALASVTLHDRLPLGFAFQRGTARVGGVKGADPLGTSTLDFAVGTMTAGQAVVVSYRLKVGTGARNGDGVNHAIASAGTSGLTQSNTASVRVLLSDGGVFSDRAYLIGKVYADCNANGIQDRGERGIPGVRIVLEDGTSAITDEDGKYSLYGLIARTHVAKVDATSMIDGTTLEVLDHRNAGDADSRFVDLKNGELHRADFAVAGCGPALEAAIDQRRGLVSGGGETDAAAKALLSATRSANVDLRTLPSSGVLDAKGIVGRTGLPGDPVTAATVAAEGAFEPSANARLRTAVDQPLGGESATPATPAPKPIDLADLLPTLADGLAFIGLDDDAVVPNQATIRAKGPANVKWSLFVDGRRVDDRQVGTRSVVADRNLVVVEYVGVDLAPGANRLELIAQDDFGNARERVAVTVRSPGRLARIAIDVPAEAKADGRTPIPVRVRLLDANDLPVVGRRTVTLDATQGRWMTKDLDPREAGTQVLVDGGVLDVDLLSPADPGKATLRATTGTLKVDAPITFTPDLRPMLAVGLVEGVLNLRSLGGNALAATQSGDTFEREIRNATRDFANDRASAEARAALYLKGKVLGSTLLTLAYDSDKPQRERLFRDIQPDQFYPVYGDSSVKGFDAQSTSRLYVRVDQGSSYVLYGDYTTQSEDPARSLTLYNRALTGAKGRIDEGPLRVDGFAAYTNSQQVVDELRGNGTSGPFTLSRPNGLVNSEQVHVLTRDRNQPAIVLRDVPLTRFADYEIEAFTGRILFKAPIPSVDADLNPVSIRITYEVDSGGPNFWVGGVDAKLAVTDHATVGGTYIRDTDPSNRATLRGVNGTVKLAEKALLVGEFAESDSDLHGLGKGRRVEYRQDTEDLQARLYAGKTDLAFVNPNALLSQGRGEYGGKFGLRLNEADRLVVEGLRTEDPATGGRRDGLLARIERSFDGNIKVEVGMRHANETVAPAQPTSVGATPINFNSLRTKVTVPVPVLSDASVFGEYERAVGEGNRQIAAIGGSVALPSGGKLYARHEFISSLSGAYDLNSTQRLTTTVIGIDSDYMKDGHVFNEYRVGGGIDARSAEAAVGLRNLWRIADGVNVTTTAENIKPVGGPVDNRSTALTGAIDYTANPLWKGSARAEYRNATESDSWLLTTGGAFKLSDETTLLAKAIYSDIAAGPTSTGLRRVARAQVGAAYRPVDTDVWNALGRVEIKREQDGTIVSAPLDEIATIASAHLNVSPSPDLTIAGRYGIKRATDRSNGFESRSTTQLLGARAIKDLDAKWDVGLNSFLLASNGIRSRNYALGLEGGYRVATNLWVSTGYNFSGFKDKDLAGEDYTQRGIYLRMRYKFDENLFAPKPVGAAAGAKGDAP